MIDAAVADGRVVAFLGRSMQNSVGAARRLGILKIDDRDVIDIAEVDALDPGRVVIICTGSQGEPYSALSLMAAREHKWVKLNEGDTVVLSSSLIPGNEPAIHRVVDALYRSGADVYHVPADAVHASGHAAQEELRLMLSLVRPRWFVPIHGERRHLQHHARIAEEVGIPHDRILICEDGDVLEVGAAVERVDRVRAGMTFVDGIGIGDVGGAVLRDRRKLADDGVVVVVVTVDAQTGELVGGPDIVNRGFVHEETSGEIVEVGARPRGAGVRGVRRCPRDRSVGDAAEHPPRPEEALLRADAAQARDPAGRSWRSEPCPSSRTRGSRGCSRMRRDGRGWHGCPTSPRRAWSGGG